MAANKDRIVPVTAIEVSVGRDCVELRQRPCYCALDATSHVKWEKIGRLEAGVADMNRPGRGAIT